MPQNKDPFSKLGIVELKALERGRKRLCLAESARGMPWNETVSPLTETVSPLTETVSPLTETVSPSTTTISLRG